MSTLAIASAVVILILSVVAILALFGAAKDADERAEKMLENRRDDTAGSNRA